MRLKKLYVTNFGGIESAEVEFGPGLNVLHGPNDLGKSTLVEAIRLGLLLPHGSTHGELGAVLKASLKDDPAASGKERIAAALEAMAQDPRFVEVLRKTQERWE